MSKLSLDNLATAPKAEPLIVVSKAKSYVKARTTGMRGALGSNLPDTPFNTSDKIEVVLSQLVRNVLDHAIVNAAGDGRKTVLDRDIIAAIGHALHAPSADPDAP